MDWQKHCKNSKNPYIPFTHIPKVLTSWITRFPDKIRKFDNSVRTDYEPYSNVPIVSASYVWSRWPAVFHAHVFLVSFNLGQFFSHLAFYDLDTLGAYWPKNIPQFGLVWCFHIIKLKLYIFDRSKWCVSLSIREAQLLQVMSVSFLLWIVTISHLYLVSSNMETPYFSSEFFPLTSTSIYSFLKQLFPWWLKVTDCIHHSFFNY